MTKQTRQRQLAQLRTRREAERRRAQQRRARRLYGSLAAIVLLVGAVAVVVVRSGREQAAPAAPAPAPLDARADAPGAPAAVACGGKVPPRSPKPTFTTRPPTSVRAGVTYEAVVATSCGPFTIRLDAKAAPATVSSFVFLARRKLYDGTWFHRIVPGGPGSIGVVQGGDPEGDGTGGPGYRLPDELPKGRNPYRKYTVAMANSGPNTSGSQFFVSTQDNPTSALASNYTLFGVVTEGRAVIDRIAKVPVGGERGDTPTQSVWIETVTIRTS
jgi:peptidyl-prolyl cis-trans isomerase B (cyclophilin B)